MQERYADRLNGITGSAIRDIFKLISRPGVISFAGGNPAPSSFEPEIIAQLAVELMAQKGAELLQYGATEGYAPLRESTTEYLKRAGILAQPDHILPTTGSTQAIYLLLMALINPGDVVLVEQPTFLGTLQAMALLQADVKAIETDDEGAVPQSVEALCKVHKPKAVYLIPNFQNPSGRTMSLARRKAMAALAQQYDFILLEDDPYRELRYEGESLPAIKSFDQSGNVVYLTSYSKVISPGLRVGAAVISDDALRRKVVICKQSSDTHTALLNQALVDCYIRTGRLDKHIPAICKDYGAKRDAMIKGFDAFPTGTQYIKPQGGLFLWADLPQDINAVDLLATAADRGVAFVPGTHFYIEKGTNLHTVRLNFSNAAMEQIIKGMDLLAQVVKAAK